MKRRQLFESALLTGAAALGLRRAASAAAPPRPGRWILPTDTPDRYHLKVMAFNPIPAPDPRTWELTIGGLVARAAAPARAGPRAASRASPRAAGSSACSAGRAACLWEGFRCGELLKLAGPKPGGDVGPHRLRRPLLRLREDGGPAAPADAVRGGDERRAAEPRARRAAAARHPLQVRLPLEQADHEADPGGRGLPGHRGRRVARLLLPTGEIEPGVDHPFDFPGEARKIKGGEILDY